MDFIKFLAAGKDYIFIPDRSDFESLTKQRAEALCDRRTGIGAEGIFTFDKIDSKTAHMRGLLKNGDNMHDFSTASICTVFSDNFKNDIIECVPEGNFSEKISIFRDKSSPSALFSCDPGICKPCTYLNKKTEIGNRILTLSCIEFHGVHTVHFSECAESFNLSYLGRKIAGNSIFRKSADITIAQKNDEGGFTLYHYENKTGSPSPTVSAFAAIAIAACKTGNARYDTEIRLSCNGTEVFAFCRENGSCVIQCSAIRVYEGRI